MRVAAAQKARAIRWSIVRLAGVPVRFLLARDLLPSTSSSESNFGWSWSVMDYIPSTWLCIWRLGCNGFIVCVYHCWHCCIYLHLWNYLTNSFKVSSTWSSMFHFIFISQAEMVLCSALTLSFPGPWLASIVVSIHDSLTEEGSIEFSNLFLFLPHPSWWVIDEPTQLYNVMITIQHPSNNY